MSLAGIVLAAGPSARMGFPKALLDFRGAPFVVRVLEALEALDVKPRVVVLGPDAARVRPVLATRDCLVAENPVVDTGPLGSLLAGWEALHIARPAGALVWPVDRPHVRIATVEHLVEMQRRTGAAAVAPVFAGRRGEPIILTEPVLRGLVARPVSDTVAILDGQPDVLEVPVDDAAVVASVAAPADYERWLRQADGESG